jgi:dTMP kinase
LELDKGYLIVFEGIDGTGKSTHIKLLEQYLLNQKIDVVRLFEPTKGEWGLKIRKILTDGRQGITPEDELKLFIKDREDDVEKNILPALRNNKVVLIDRYYFSTAAYQGALGLDPEEICNKNEEFAPIPDLVLLFFSSPEECLKRIEKSREEFSSFEKLEYLQKVQKIFDSFSRPEIKRIDSNLPKNTVHDNVVNEVKKLLDLK